jgi:hypothetical protein
MIDKLSNLFSISNLLLLHDQHSLFRYKNDEEKMDEVEEISQQ